LVAVLRKKMIDAIEVIYVLFLGVCMSTFCEMMMLEHMVHLCVVLSSRSCIVVFRQVNVAVVATALFAVYSTYTLS